MALSQKKKNARMRNCRTLKPHTLVFIRPHRLSAVMRGYVVKRLAIILPTECYTFKPMEYRSTLLCMFMGRLYFSFHFFSGSYCC